MKAEQVRSYLLHLLEERKLSWSAIHVNRAALRFLYVRVLRQRWFDEEIQAPKRHPLSAAILRTPRCFAAFLNPPRSPGPPVVQFRRVFGFGLLRVFCRARV